MGYRGGSDQPGLEKGTAADECAKGSRFKLWHLSGKMLSTGSWAAWTKAATQVKKSQTLELSYCSFLIQSSRVINTPQRLRCRHPPSFAWMLLIPRGLFQVHCYHFQFQKEQKNQPDRNWKQDREPFVFIHVTGNLASQPKQQLSLDPSSPKEGTMVLEFDRTLPPLYLGRGGKRESIWTIFQVACPRTTE